MDLQRFGPVRSELRAPRLPGASAVRRRRGGEGRGRHTHVPRGSTAAHAGLTHAPTRPQTVPKELAPRREKRGEPYRRLASREKRDAPPHMRTAFSLSSVPVGKGVQVLFPARPLACAGQASAICLSRTARTCWIAPGARQRAVRVV